MGRGRVCVCVCVGRRRRRWRWRVRMRQVNTKQSAIIDRAVAMTTWGVVSDFGVMIAGIGGNDIQGVVVEGSGYIQSHCRFARHQ